MKKQGLEYCVLDLFWKAIRPMQQEHFLPEIAFKGTCMSDTLKELLQTSWSKNSKSGGGVDSASPSFYALGSNTAPPINITSFPRSLKAQQKRAHPGIFE